MKHEQPVACRTGANDYAPPRPSPRQRKRRRWKKVGLVLMVIAVLLGIARALMPWAVRDYVNRTLDSNPLYSGEIGAVRIHLWRGAYSIENVRIHKAVGNVPVPFFAARQVDFAIQWKNLFHRRIVGRVIMDEPQINLVAASSEADSQTGAQGPWLQIIEDLFPFKINNAIVKNGSVHFRAFKDQPFDVYLSGVEGSIDNLGNIRDETAPLIATAQFNCQVMDQAKMQGKMSLDPFSYRPTFHLAVRLLGLDVTKINDLALAYGKFDFKRGWFDLVVEADAKEGQLTGYVKPLFRDLQVFSLDDLAEKNVLQTFWQALVGTATTLFKNQPRDQFGTLIPFHGDLSGATTTDLLSTLGNVLRNAFVRAYLPRLENGQVSDESITFEPPQFTEILSVDTPL